MEKVPQNQKEKKQCKQTGKKRYGFLNFLRVLTYMLRRKSPKRVVVANSNALLKELVGSVRPFHLRHSSPLHIGVSVDENLENQISPPRSKTSDDGASRYASAQNLKDLDKGDANEEEEGDGEVDRKAEEFIANFYKQMRMQRRDSIYKYHDIV